MGLLTRFITLFTLACLLAACSGFTPKNKAPVKRDPNFKFGVLRAGLAANNQPAAEIWLSSKPISCNTSGSFQRISAVLNVNHVNAVRANIALSNPTNQPASSCDANWQCRTVGAINIQVTREHQGHLQGTWELPQLRQKGPFNIRKCAG